MNRQNFLIACESNDLLAIKSASVQNMDSTIVLEGIRLCVIHNSFESFKAIIKHSYPVHIYDITQWTKNSRTKILDIFFSEELEISSLSIAHKNKEEHLMSLINICGSEETCVCLMTHILKINPNYIPPKDLISSNSPRFTFPSYLKAKHIINKSFVKTKMTNHFGN
jgi:hypothetical protein